MGYAQFVGRVGALAVALGVTNVVGHPLIAWAEEPSAESSNTDSAPSTGTPSTGTPDKPSETQSPDPTTAPTRDPVDTEDADATDVETGTDVSVVETSYPTTTPAPETEEATAPQPKTVTDDAPQAKDPHPTETEPAPTATDTDDSPETTEQRRFVAQALAVSGVNEQSLDAPLATRLAIPVAADLATSSAAPEAAVSITKVDPVTVEEAHPFRSLVLGFLGIFGFDPTPGATNDALLTALWAAYRGYERRFENETPTVSGATIVSTSQTEDGYTAVRISVGFTDPDGDTLHYSTTNGHAGTLTANTDGTFTYLTNTVGTDTVTITANDDDGTGHLHGLLGWLFKPAAGHTRTVTLALNITGSINHAPVGTDDTATTNEDTPVVIHVLANDTDPDNDPLSIGSFSNGAHGTVTLDGDTLTYTPDQNYNGTDEFSYTTTDGTLASLTTHVFITINPVNDAPVITVSAVGQPDPTTGVVVGHVTATDVDGDALTYSGTATTTHGSVTVDTDGTFTYTPTADARHAAAADGVGTVTDSFTVTVSDSHGGVANATLTPTVAPQNTAPSFNTAGAITILGLGTDWPTKIVYSPNGSHAYTVVTTHDPDTDSDSFSLAVIDTTTNAFTKIPLSGYVDANSLTVSPNGGRVYAVGASNGDSPVYSLTVFDTASNTISSIPFTGYVYNPLLGITVSPDSSHVYLSSLDSTNYVYVANIFDPAANSVVSVPLAPRFYPYQPSFNSDGSKVYLTAGGDYTTGYQQTLSQIDSSTGVINTINLPSLPQNFTFSSDGTRAYATFSANTGGQLAVIDTATLTTTWITIPAISRTMVISPDNRYVYATASDNTLMVVDTTTTAVTNIALVGSEFMQDLLAVAPDGNTAYVVTGSGPFSNFDYQDHSLEIVDLTTHNITAIPLASRPLEVTGQPRRNLRIPQRL